VGLLEPRDRPRPVHGQQGHLSQTERISFTATAQDAGRRLDQVLPARVPGLSRRRARVLIDLGGVFIDRRRVKVAGRPLRKGEQVVAHLGGALQRAENKTGTAARDAEEQRLPSFTVVFEDEDVIVVDKPAGLLTAPTPESDRGNLLGVLARQRQAPVFLVHRLDLPTSGLIIFAKTDPAMRALAERFRTHALERQYLGVVAGAFPARITLIDRVVNGRKARTHVAVEERFGDRATLIRCTLETGRTHQIRLHAEAVGHPVLGDREHGGVAGDRTPLPPRLALHATRLALPHPRTGAPLAFDSPWPADLAPWLGRLRETPAASAGG
jgi:23S rRNA pseudouridine1911/1915/1917 synthase